MKTKIIKTYLSFTSILIFGLLFFSFTNKMEPFVKNIQHGIVYYKEGKFAAWPANQGIWSWDNEILVGFVEACHKDTSRGHTLDPTTSKHKYARSKDGGNNWIIEDAFEHGQTAIGERHNLKTDESRKPLPLKNSIEDFTSEDFALTFVRKNNGRGPSHFYFSENRGVNWNGPFQLNIDIEGVATRTDYIVEGKNELSAFMTLGEGRVIFAKTTDGGKNWKMISSIGTGQERNGWDIMPSSVRLSSSELYTVIRTRTGNGLDLLTGYYSGDNGKTWEKQKNPVSDTGSLGSPPALLKMKDGRLALAYIYRSKYGSRVNIRFSSDNGKKWGDEIILRSGDGANRDVGYPQMVQRPDGKLVIVYYWNNANQEGAKPYRYIASTIVDPAQFK